MSKILLIDTSPVRLQDSPTLNVGMHMVENILQADLNHQSYVGDISQYDTLAFNIYYITHNLNALRFLLRHNVPLDPNDRDMRVIAGGQGVYPDGFFKDILNEIFLGELDGDTVDRYGFTRQTKLTSLPIIAPLLKKAVVEVSRGCKYRCTFCEYGNWHGGTYREKDVKLVKEQVLEAGVKNINLLSMNLGGYSQIEELLDFCNTNEITVTNADSCPVDIRNLGPVIQNRPIRIGLESFDEDTRKRITPGKYVSDDELESVIDFLFDTVAGVYIYLIYGLPDDNYDRWFVWLEKIKTKRSKISRRIRVEFALNTFEPIPNTPLGNAPRVDFDKRDNFLSKWLDALVRLGYRSYGSGLGRWGRGKRTCDFNHALRHYDNQDLAPLIKICSGGERPRAERVDRFLKEVHNGEATQLPKALQCRT